MQLPLLIMLPTLSFFLFLSSFNLSLRVKFSISWVRLIDLHIQEEQASDPFVETSKCWKTSAPFFLCLWSAPLLPRYSFSFLCQDSPRPLRLIQFSMLPAEQRPDYLERFLPSCHLRLLLFVVGPASERQDLKITYMVKFWSLSHGIWRSLFIPSFGLCCAGGAFCVVRGQVVRVFGFLMIFLD